MDVEIEDFISTFDPLLNQTSDAVAVLDLNGEYHYGNKSIGSLLGFTDYHLYSSSFKDIISASSSYLKLISGKLNIDSKIIHREKFVHPNDKKQNCFAGFLPLVNKDKMHFGWSVIFNNRSNSLAVEKSLKSNSFLNCLNSLSNDSCIVQNFETGEIVFVSDSFQELSGWSKNEIKQGGMFLFCLLMNIHDKDYIFRIAELVKSRNKSLIERTQIAPVKLRTKLRKKNLSYTDLEINTSIISLPEDPGVYYGISFMHGCNENISDDHINYRRNIPLTHREIEIVDLLAKGFSSKMIANKYMLKEGYISQIRKRLLKKFNVNNTPELVRILHADGYL